jgi:hypothetical protein
MTQRVNRHRQKVDVERLTEGAVFRNEQTNLGGDVF